MHELQLLLEWYKETGWRMFVIADVLGIIAFGFALGWNSPDRGGYEDGAG